MKYVKHWLWLVLLLVTLPGRAQGECPLDILQALARAGTACVDLERNAACYGYGTVQATFDAASTESLSLPGERAAVDLMQQLVIGGEDAPDFSVALMQLQASIVSNQPGRNLALLAFGDVTLTNLVPVRPTVQVASTGLLNVRARPDATSDILIQVPVRGTLTANGMTAEGDWLRVSFPDSPQLGWVARDVVTVEGNTSALNIVDEDTPFLRPFQVMNAMTAQHDAACEGVPESGILLQAPNTEETVDLSINGLSIGLAGTGFLQAVPGEAMTLWMVDGFARLRAGGEPQYVVAGSFVRIELSQNLEIASELPPAAPYDSADVAGLPVNNLNYRVAIAAPISASDLETQVAALAAEPTEEGEPDETSQRVSQRCIYTAARTTTIYAGPGTFHEVIRELDVGTRLFPILRLTNSEGVTWWQLHSGHWMLASNARSEGECGEIPVTDIVAAPLYNTLSLERCEALNGPIRAWQIVTIEFSDGGWETIEEALNAPRIDPGRITVNQQWLWVQAGDPVQVAEERFYRTFRAQWFAQPGTYRIVGSRLSYSVICDITVPFG